MSADEQMWKAVGERFAELGRQIKTRYQQQGEPASADRTEEDAVHRLADGLDRMFTAAGGAARDPVVGEHARQAARSLADALSATFQDVSEGLRDRFKQTGQSRPGDDLPRD